MPSILLSSLTIKFFQLFKKGLRYHLSIFIPLYPDTYSRFCTDGNKIQWTFDACASIPMPTRPKKYFKKIVFINFRYVALRCPLEVRDVWPACGRSWSPRKCKESHFWWKSILLVGYCSSKNLTKFQKSDYIWWLKMNNFSIYGLKLVSC